MTTPAKAATQAKKAAPAKKAPAKKAPAKKAPGITTPVWDGIEREGGDGYSPAMIEVAKTGHGKYQVMPSLSEADLADLKDSVSQFGVLVPIIIDEDGQIIEGHHRVMAAVAAGKPIPVTVAGGLTEAEKFTVAYTSNLARRHLTREQKRELVADSIKRDPALSDRQHAERIGVSPTTVGSIRSKLEDDGSVSKLDSRTTKSGREQAAAPAARPVIAAGRIEEAVTFVAFILEGDDESARLALWDFGYWFDSYGCNRNGTRKKGASEQVTAQLGISDRIIDDALTVFSRNPSRAKYANHESSEMIPGTDIPRDLPPQPMTPPARSSGKAADEAGAFDGASGKTAADEKKAQADDDARYQRNVLLDLNKRATVIRGDLISLRENWVGDVSKADAKTLKSVLDSLRAALIEAEAI